MLSYQFLNYFTVRLNSTFLAVAKRYKENRDS